VASVDADTGQETVRFETDSDRHAWRDYASHALAGMANMSGGESVNPARLASAVGQIADAMLREERARRREGRRGRR